MSSIVDNIFEKPKGFFFEWGPCSGTDASNWKFFTEAAAHLSFASLASSDTFNSQGEFISQFHPLKYKLFCLVH